MLFCDIVATLGGETIVAPRFEAPEGLTVLFGASGAGKTVTLKAIAGLLRPQRGTIRFNGTVFFDATTGTWLPPARRDVSYVPQSLGLYPHMSVAENVAFAIDRRRVGEPARRIRDVLAMLDIEALAERMPRTLSGGQQQRVALARALARSSRLVLLDEPFSALDESLRSRLRQELLRLRSDFDLSVIFVTHDLREAHLLAERLAVFDEGRVLQFDDRETVFRRPVTRRVAELTGVANIFRSRVVEDRGAAIVVEASGARLACDRPPGLETLAPGTPVDVAIRAERVILRRLEAGTTEPGTNLIAGRVAAEFAYGATHTLRMAPTGPGPSLDVEIAARPYEVLGIAARKDWVIELPPADLHVMRV
ncbi:MAG: ABC transporter ATP-binding protein [Dehalococcoidia bacterium]